MEKKNLTVEISARVKELLGAEDLERRLNQIQEKINEPLPEVAGKINEVRETPEYKQFEEESGVRPFYKKILEAPAEILHEDTAKLDERIEKTRDKAKTEIESYIASGTEPKRPTLNKYERWYSSLENEIEEVFGKALDRMKEKLDKAETEGEAGMIEQEMLAIREMKDEYLDAVHSHKEGLDGLIEATRKADSGTKNLIDTLSKLGILGFGANLLQQGIDLYTRYGVMEENIAKRYGTAFDLSSPIQTFSMQEQAKLFERTSRRSYEAEVEGSLLGGGIGAGLGALAFAVPGIGTATAIAAMIGGAASGQGLGKMILGRSAQEQNIAEQEELERQLKYINQANAIITQNVQSYRQLDIAETQLEARAGRETRDRTLGDIGYTRAQEAQFEKMFSALYGRYDQDLFREQVETARATGLDADQFFQMNRTAQITGVDFGKEQIAGADLLRRELYGEKSDSQKIVDVLESIRGLQERMLQVNIDADAREAQNIARLPALIFGENSPYGRIDQLGGKTMSHLEDLMKPQSLAQEAFLYNIFDRPDLKTFEEIKKGGLLGVLEDKDLTKKFFEGFRDVGKMFPDMMYFMLNNMMPGAPKGFIPKIQELFTKGEVEVEDREGKKKTVTIEDIINPEKSKEAIDSLMKGYKESAEKFTSESEKIMTAVNDVQVRIGERWNVTIGDMEKQTQSFIESMSQTEETFNQITDAFQSGITELVNFFEKMTKQDTLIDKTEELLGRELTESERKEIRFSRLSPDGDIEDYEKKLSEWIADRKKPPEDTDVMFNVKNLENGVIPNLDRHTEKVNTAEEYYKELRESIGETERTKSEEAERPPEKLEEREPEKVINEITRDILKPIERESGEKEPFFPEQKESATENLINEWNRGEVKEERESGVFPNLQATPISVEYREVEPEEINYAQIQTEGNEEIVMLLKAINEELKLARYEKNDVPETKEIHLYGGNEDYSEIWLHKNTINAELG